MIQSFAIEIISINRRKKTKTDVIHDKNSHWRDVDRWTWWSVNRSKPSSVDSRSSSDWFSRELLGRWSLDSSSTCFEPNWPSESWTWGVKDRRFDTVFFLRTCCSYVSVFSSYFPSIAEEPSRSQNWNSRPCRKGNTGSRTVESTHTGDDTESLSQEHLDPCLHRWLCRERC